MPKYKRRRRRRPWKESFCNVIYMTLKQAHLDVEISKNAVAVLNSMCMDFFHKTTLEAVRLKNVRGYSTLSQREMETAVRMTFPGHLAQQAVNEASKACSKWLAYKPVQKKNA